MIKIAVINGPNLNLLGEREKGFYGCFTYDELTTDILNFAKNNNIEVSVFQSNIEGEIINEIHRLRKWADGIVINAAGYTHTSVAIRDALIAFGKPVVEVHISNVYKRENFRHKSYISDIAEGVIAGLGKYSYIYAIDFLNNLLKK
ncbi:type II 3-dehydroquinate dehydratase [Deferribacter autotrophicus]|uniref:type II 3-dehydroquinate dehydratase n=1 Tax=Deferribacter autotrophicus TaxID=500465 RepID=UPI001FF06AFA|nr:type II 3-dehydroquinate dehydratase [Deferribacter autotrophicus]